MVEALHAFGEFVLDPGCRLLRNGRAVALGQRGIALLEALLEARGSIVSKDVLMERVWPGIAVEESNLTVQVAALRKALGPAPDGQEWIATVPRVGYRFIRTNAEAKAAATAPELRPTLAVLPFSNLSGDPRQDYFADGIVDDIIAALSRFRSFAVVARDCSFAYKGSAMDVRKIAAELGVGYVLEGSIRQSGNRLRIVAELVERQSSTHIWAQTFDGTLDEIFDFQDRITDSVAMLIEPLIQTAEIERSRRERPGSVATYDIYLQALAKISTEIEGDNAAAYALLMQGLAAEPNNAQLLAHATWALEHRYTMGWPALTEDDVQACGALARRALEHGAGDAMVMAHCGVALMQTVKDYDWGLAVLQAAAESNPNNPMAVVRAGVGHLHCGNVSDALSHFHRANRLTPGDRGAHFSLCGIAHAHIVLGEYDQALAWASRALASNANFEPTLWVLIAASAHLGRMEEAQRHVAALKRRTPDITIERIRAGQAGKYPDRIAAVLDGLRIAGVPER
ncbi:MULTISPECIES: winged helix-turn-helix domain-containing protein [unclassified Rhizobium]|uniref:winged helix-turn-helix domain-containing tetratricopeptide repeat protein n=1 Tax=unclassified Rhizobium TaxID=2613769 RepID=UPI001044CCB2|nr:MULTISPECIES: winged helix-turn-helix domain-containing protein [unclassified Rhizobium]MBB4168132.1 TolB-like protein/tetratricopeptide (TPR) repeat protein [Rhizobium sp. BK538]TCM80807.1 TolB-like protein [Rhizobium sp. BK068]